MIRSNRVSRVKRAIGWRRVSGIATRDGRGLSIGIELGQAVEGLVGIAILGPVFSQCAKVVIEGAILLRQENDVVDGTNVLGAEHGRYLLARSKRWQGAGRAVPAAGSLPFHEIGARLRS